jgi:hypothetical protein
MQVKKQYEDYVIHYMVKGNLVSKLLKQLSQKDIDTFVAAKQHLKYFEPKANGKAKTKQADSANDVEAPTENEA